MTFYLGKKKSSFEWFSRFFFIVFFYLKKVCLYCCNIRTLQKNKCFFGYFILIRLYKNIVILWFKKSNKVATLKNSNFILIIWEKKCSVKLFQLSYWKKTWKKNTSLHSSNSPTCTSRRKKKQDYFFYIFTLFSKIWVYHKIIKKIISKEKKQLYFNFLSKEKVWLQSHNMMS